MDTDSLYGVKSALELNTKRRAQSLTMPAVFDLRWGLYGDEPLHAHERFPRGASVSTAAFDAVLPLCTLGCSRATGFVGAAIPARARLADSTAPSGVLYVLVQCRCAARLGGFGGTRPRRHSGIVLRNKPQKGHNHATLPRDITTRFQVGGAIDGVWQRKVANTQTNNPTRKQPHEQTDKEASEPDSWETAREPANI